jgi:hypothetical protein
MPLENIPVYWKYLNGIVECNRYRLQEDIMMSRENRQKQAGGRKAPLSAWRPGQSGNPWLAQGFSGNSRPGSRPRPPGHCAPCRSEWNPKTKA